MMFCSFCDKAYQADSGCDYDGYNFCSEWCATKHRKWFKSWPMKVLIWINATVKRIRQKIRNGR